MAKDNKIILTPEFRVAFPNVFVARGPMKGSVGEPKFGLTAIFPKGTDLTALKQLAKDAATAKWGEKLPTGLRNPLRDGAERPEYEGFEAGSFFSNFTSKFQPGLVDADVQPIITQADFYGGCWARCSINAYAYDNAGNKGVAFGLNNVQKTRDDAPFTKRVSAEKEFAPVAKTSGAAAPAGDNDSFLS